MTEDRIKKPTEKWHPIEYAGFWQLNEEPFYEAKNVLDAEHVGIEKAKENAYKAAAGPEMLDILKEIVNSYHKGLIHSPGEDPIILRAEAIILKAEGVTS